MPSCAGNGFQGLLRLIRDLPGGNTMSDPYDLLVIGAGTAAMVASMRVRAAGWRVAVVDSRPLGGTCALRGCAAATPRKC